MATLPAGLVSNLRVVSGNKYQVAPDGLADS